MIPLWVAVVACLVCTGAGLVFSTVRLLDVREQAYQEGYVRGRTEEARAAATYAAHSFRGKPK